MGCHHIFDKAVAVAAKLLQLCPTMCDPINGQPTRLPRPWDSLEKNTGVGCHFLLQCKKVKSESEVAQSCLTLSDLIDCSLPGSSVHGIFQARVLEWVDKANELNISRMIAITFSKSKYKECAQPLNHVQLFETPWTAACCAPLSLELSRQEY